MLVRSCLTLLLPLLATASPATAQPDPAEAAAARGIAWLVAAQNPDGSWGDEPGDPGQVGNTSLAALALLASGSTPTRGAHWQPLRRALAWLRDRAAGYGQGAVLDRRTLLQAKLGPHADLYLLTLLEAQVVGQNVDAAEDRRALVELRGAAARIASLQQPSGAWEISYEPMLTTVTAWLALRAAANAGVVVPGASAQKVVRYLLDDCLQRDRGTFVEDKWGRVPRFVGQAGALRVLYGMGRDDDDDVRHATEVLLKMRFDQDVTGGIGGEELFAAWLASQALAHVRRPEGTTWQQQATTALLALQNRDGSWSGHHCVTSRVFCTATAVMTLRTPECALSMVDL